jgi:hypothetical protein
MCLSFGPDASRHRSISFRKRSCFICSSLPKPIVLSPTIDSANRRQREQPQKPIQRLRIGRLEFDRATARTSPSHPQYPRNTSGQVQLYRIHSGRLSISMTGTLRIISTFRARVKHPGKTEERGRYQLPSLYMSHLLRGKDESVSPSFRWFARRGNNNIVAANMSCRAALDRHIRSTWLAARHADSHLVID